MILVFRCYLFSLNGWKRPNGEKESLIIKLISTVLNLEMSEALRHELAAQFK